MTKEELAAVLTSALRAVQDALTEPHVEAPVAVLVVMREQDIAPIVVSDIPNVGDFLHMASLVVRVAPVSIRVPKNT